MSFSADLTRFAIRAPEEAKRVRDGIAFKLFAAVVKDTPVLTGRLRGNWQASINVPVQTTLTTEDKGGGPTIAKIQGAVSDSPVADCRIILTNNLPYAYGIEFEGRSSVKAPDGMVYKNVTRFQQIVNQQGLGV